MKAKSRSAGASARHSRCRPTARGGRHHRLELHHPRSRRGRGRRKARARLYLFGRLHRRSDPRKARSRRSTGKDALAPQAASQAMQRAVRNLGREGLAATAISAIDTALYDLKARLLDLPLVAACSALSPQLDPDLRQRRLYHLFRRRAGATARRLGRTSMAALRQDEDRLTARARSAPGCAWPSARSARRTLFVDANGAYGLKQAIALANDLPSRTWAGSKNPFPPTICRAWPRFGAHAPAGMEIAAGEYAYTTDYLRTMLEPARSTCSRPT